LAMESVGLIVTKTKSDDVMKNVYEVMEAEPLEILMSDFQKVMKTVKPSVTKEMNEFYEQMVRKKKEKIEELNYTG